jgi:NAD+ kinase
MARNILLVTNASREAAISAFWRAAELLAEHGLTPISIEEDFSEMTKTGSEMEVYKDQQIELALVLGGDGTILRAAESLRGHKVPILGLNLGHVGFMAEGEIEDMPEIISRIASKDYSTSSRMALEVEVWQAKDKVFSSWALNDVALEKSSRERMLEVAIEVDSRPISSFGCDGVVFSTPTGSTAYNFSAGGPIVWPDVEALLVVPLSAHALFSRPLVVDRNSRLAVEVLSRNTGNGVIFCDGRRTFELTPGSRVVVYKSPTPVELAVFEDRPFADRLVKKFNLPVAGWRGPDR